MVSCRIASRISVEGDLTCPVIDSAEIRKSVASRQCHPLHVGVFMGDVICAASLGKLIQAESAEDAGFELDVRL